MAEPTPAEIEDAADRYRMMREAAPMAVAARYDVAADRIIIDLTNGATFAFPPQLGHNLAGAAPDDLAQIEVSGGGYGLHWPRLDVDLTVPGLLNGVFGTARWIATLAGRSSSPAKAAAARRNGRKGGRPRKAAA